MKKISLLIVSLLLFCAAFAQQKNLNVKNYELKNGLKIVLCKDDSKPVIWGAVCVGAGSINDPKDATGMAHYFEHIMFKGTDKIGTVNWNEEKIYLDSISLYYDKLHETNDRKQRENIQLKINELSQSAAQYAIPNEIDAILGKMGSLYVNAYTDLENTVYFNAFPSNQLQKWLQVYSERFRNPVFRLFQAELETVYEEKNMYEDSPMSTFFESSLKEAFGEHPYGRPIIGYAQHLKNPQISKMQQFFDTYYVPNNMTLILAGNLEFESAFAMIEKSFGTLSAGTVPEFPKYELPVFHGKTVIEKKQTPIKMGIIGFRTIPIFHPDILALNILEQLLSNTSNTGMLDKLILNHNLMISVPISMPFKEHGVFAFFYVPKILGQSLQKAENLIFNCIDDLKNGNFSDQQFEAVKMDYLTHEIRKVEGVENISYLLLDYVTSGRNYQEYDNDIERIKLLKKEDIVTVAQKYFCDDYLIYRSKMGSAKKDNIGKPKWKPVQIHNTDAQSVFAKNISEEPVMPISPQIIDFKKDIIIDETNPFFPVYAVQNPCNDIFSLKIYYKYGNYYNKHLINAIDYVSDQGSQEMSLQEMNTQLQLLGASVDIYTDDYLAYHDLSTIEITGYDADFEKIMQYCSQKFFNTGNDEKILEVIREAHTGNLKIIKKDAEICSEAVFQYMRFGDDSEYLRTPTTAEMKNYTGKMLIEYVREIFYYPGFVFYSGNLEPKFIYKQLIEHHFIKEEGLKQFTPEKDNKFIPTEKLFTENEVYFYDNKKFVQSNIIFYVPGMQMTGKDKNKILSKCFNQYFGNDMYSIVFQEIRELRSLSYAAYSGYWYDYLDRKPSNLYASLGTQCDKTIEGIDAMTALITNMPQKEDKFATAKESLLTIEKSNYFNFREIPAVVYKWKAEGYTESPTPQVIETIESISFDEVLDFYHKTIQNKPVIISLSGNMKKISKFELSKFGIVRQVKEKEIFGE